MEQFVSTLGAKVDDGVTFDPYKAHVTSTGEVYRNNVIDGD
jgi:hypothetical protein